MQSRSKSKEQISDEKLSFFESKSPKEISQQQQNSGYTREYSYNIDSETLRHSGQTDPRGLGFSYEKANAPSLASSKSVPQKHKGTALAFTYNPQNSSRPETISERSGTQQKEAKPSESKYKSAIPKRSFQASDEKIYQTKTKSTEIKGEPTQSNIDESSELSSTSQESMVDEYAKESMRQKTSALIAGSAANVSPTVASANFYKTPPTSYVSQTTSPSKQLDINEQYPRYGSTQTQPVKQQRTSLWGQERSTPSSTRLPVLSPTDSERKYTHISRVRTVKNADGSIEETEEILEPGSIDSKPKALEKSYAPSVNFQFCLVFFSFYSYVHIGNSSISNNNTNNSSLHYFSLELGKKLW